jgi:hypothetical protein
MNHPIRQILQSKLSATGSEITICIEVSLNVTVNRAQECIETDVELSLVN